MDSIYENDLSECEIICIDDCSTDNSKVILSSFPEIKLICHEVNRGVSAARNTGIEVARGQYIWFVDSDDLISPNALGLIIKCIMECKADLIKLKSVYFWEDRNCIYSTKNVAENSGYNGNDFLIWNNIFSLEIIKEYNIRFKVDLKYNEDVLFNHQVRMYSSYITHLDCLAYFYRLRETSTMGKLTSIEGKKQHVMSHIRFCQYISDELKTELGKRNMEAWKYLNNYAKYIADELVEMPFAQGLRLIEYMKKSSFITEVYLNNGISWVSERYFLKIRIKKMIHKH